MSASTDKAEELRAEALLCLRQYLLIQRRFGRLAATVSWCGYCATHPMPAARRQRLRQMFADVSSTERFRLTREIEIEEGSG